MYVDVRRHTVFFDQTDRFLPQPGLARYDPASGQLLAVPGAQAGDVVNDVSRDGNRLALASADQAAVARWYPLYCFAELYHKAPSLDGQLIPGCIVSVIHEVRAETGVTLTEEDVQSPDVLAHFKTVYGKDQPWRD